MACSTRSTDPLYKKSRVVGLRLAITLMRRCRPVGGLDDNYESHEADGRFTLSVG